MNITVPLALFGWIPFTLLLFMAWPRPRAVILGFLGAWMFLPAAGYEVPGLPDYTKATAATYGVLLGALVFDRDRLLSYRPSLFDIPMLVWCLCPFASSMANGLGAYDGVSAVVDRTLLWGLPYWLGRVYVRDLQDLRETAFCLFAAGLVYVPLCLFEVRMSPQLNPWIYGFGGGRVAYAAELGKWGARPQVFMGAPLTLGMFMTAASLAGFWLWFTGSLKRVWGCSAGWLVTILIVTAIMCKNFGALALLAAGLTCLLSIRYLNTAIAVYLLVGAAPLYMFARGTGRMSGDAMVSFVQGIHQTRAESLQVRLDNENRLVEKAMQQPVFGWGGWGRNRVYNEEGRDITLTDGLWVIALGQNGLVGLAAVTVTLLGPVIAFLRRYPPRQWLHPAVAPGGVLAVLVGLYMIDCLFNAMLNPVYLLVLGGLVCAAVRRVAVPLAMSTSPVRVGSHSGAGRSRLQAI